MPQAGVTFSPLDEIARLEASARTRTTPCGTGRLVWRLWGGGPPLVLLHGNFGSWTHWIRNVETLARFFTLLVPDTPGFGDSDLPPVPESPRAIGSIVAEGIREIVPADQKVVVLGFSYGGRLAGEIAALLGDRLSLLFVVAPGGLGVDDSIQRGIRKLAPRMTADEIAAVHRYNLATLMLADADAVDDLAVRIQDSNTRRARIRLTAWSLEDRRSSLLRALRDVRVPVKGIWADRDAFAEGTLQYRMNTLWQLHPDAEVRILRGVGHWMQYEAPDRFHNLLVEMLRGAV